MRSHLALPKRSHSQPMITAVAREAMNRATTIIGSPGNATKVEASTMGLIAGAERRKASAAAGGTPRDIKLLATGTDAHSHPGSTAPAHPATGTASAGFFGRAFFQNDAGTKAAIAPESTTPSTRKGSAWTMIEMKIVAPVWSAGSSKRPTNQR